MRDLADVLAPGRRLVMGVVNVTPDSFSDGGRFLDPARAVEHGRALARAGADVLDVGGESTRPGAEPVEVAEELERVVPVVTRLARDTDVVVSVDTTKALVAATCLAAGATVVNDISGGTFEPEILRVAAEASAGFVAMHTGGRPATMQRDPRYADVVTEVGDALGALVDAAAAAGIRPDRVLADPGIGFGKTVEHNVALLAGLHEVRRRCGTPLLVGPSRKAFLGAVAPGAAEPGERDDATLAAVVWCFDHGAAMVRVHDAARARAAADLLDLIDEQDRAA